jgi:hypothetical protein
VGEDKRSSARLISCPHCQLDVTITSDDGALNLAYDFSQWRSKCCCSHLSGPASCCSFLALEDIKESLLRPPNNER